MTGVTVLVSDLIFLVTEETTWWESSAVIDGHSDKHVERGDCQCDCVSCGVYCSVNFGEILLRQN